MRVGQAAEDVGAVVRLDHVDLLARAHLLAAGDGHGELGLLAGEFLELALQRGPLVAARLVLPDRLVYRYGGPGDGVLHDRSWRFGFCFLPIPVSLHALLVWGKRLASGYSAR